MSQSSKVPPTPKLASVSLPDDNDNANKIFGGSRKRLSSLLSKGFMTPKIGPRSMTPVPVAVSRHEYPAHGEYIRQRSSSLTNRTPIVPPIPVPEQARGRAPKYPPALAHHSHSHSSSSRSSSSAPRPPIVAPTKHTGPDTPKYMKATAKEVALKDESIVLNWPLVPYAERRHLNYPLVYYDIAFDPRDAANVKDNRKKHFLALPVKDRELPVSTHCKITEMVIDCPHVGSLVVERAEGLRCIDVFYAIYCKYQKKPRSHEMPNDRARYQRAFEQRCNDCPGLSDFNMRHVGFLRVDLLRGKRIFEGLERSNGRWQLVFDSPAR